jgi:sugar phosphate isomerase/epimerase
MNISISNIAWSNEYDNEMYLFLSEEKVYGLEIAPTRIFPENPYEHISEAKEFARMLGNVYGIFISSMQSIWYGRSENIFKSENDLRILIDYTKDAILFAEAIGCMNLVFGCPRNRNMSNPDQLPIAIDFFRIIGEFAILHKTIIAIEPNPAYYGTNFINTTGDAFEICREINCVGIKINVDMGTIIHYSENIEFINDNIELVNHIHISEPQLEIIKKRKIHKKLKELNYNNWFSIEMKNIGNINTVKKTVNYIKEILS